jgi:hypothetical protein
MTKRCPASPAPIVADEKVIRGIYSPEIFDAESGRIIAAAVKLDELMSKGGIVDQCGESSGVSVFRIDHAGGLDQATTELQTLVSRPRRERPPRTAIGFSTMSASAIMNVPEGPLSLLDDGGDDLTCHAVVRAPPDRTKSSLRGARDNLVQMMNEALVKFPLSEPERSKIMSRLKAILAELEAATTFPWPDPLEAVHLENRFERDCKLIGDEGAGLWARFDKVMDRLHLLKSGSVDSRNRLI